MRIEKTPHSRIIFLVAFFLLFLFSYGRGFITVVQGWGEPYYFINYSGGFIKRGLIGEIYSWFFGEQGYDPQKIVLIYHFVSIVFFASIPCFLYHIVKLPCRVLIPPFMIFLASQFTPTLAYIVGYLDLFVFCVLLLCLSLFIKRQTILFCFASTIGILIHELFLFLWIPFLLIFLEDSIRRSGSVKVALSSLQFASSLFPVALVIVVGLMHNKTAVHELLFSAPLDRGLVKTMAENQFGLGPLKALSVMYDIWKDHWFYVFKTVWIFATPTLVLVLFFWRQSGGNYSSLLWLLAAAFSPLSVLLIAWDYSRFFCYTSFSALMGSALFLHLRVAGSQEIKLFFKLDFVNILVVTTFVFFLAFPFFYLYFGSGIVIDQRIWILKNSLGI
jgi:hypothetical protein